MAAFLLYLFTNVFCLAVARGMDGSRLKLPGSIELTDFAKCSDVNRIVADCQNELKSFLKLDDKKKRGYTEDDMGLKDRNSMLENCLLHRQELTVREYMAWCEHKSSVARKLAVCYRYLLDSLDMFPENVLMKGVETFEECVLNERATTGDHGSGYKEERKPPSFENFQDRSPKDNQGSHPSEHSSEEDDDSHRPYDDRRPWENDSSEPGDDSREPGDDSREPGYDSREPGYDSREPGDDSREPGDDSRESGDDSRESGDDSRESGDDSRESGDDSRESGDDSRESGDDSRESGGYSRESGEYSREPVDDSPKKDQDNRDKWTYSEEEPWTNSGERNHMRGPDYDDMDETQPKFREQKGDSIKSNEDKDNSKSAPSDDDNEFSGSWSYSGQDNSYYYPRREKGLGNDTSGQNHTTVTKEQSKPPTTLTGAQRATTKQAAMSKPSKQ